MSAPPGEYYTEERWKNWIERIEAESIDPEEEDSARLLLNLQDDAAIAVAKIVTDYEDGELDTETALEEIGSVRDIVLKEVEMDDEEKLMVVDGVQTSLVCVFYAAEEYVAGDVAEASIDDLIEAAGDAEASEDMDAALGYCVQAGTRIFADEDELSMDVVDELEFGLVAEWVNGLDSLQTALSDPEVVEEDED
ncbi:DUF2150 family protein [Halorhabdus sp. CBA1104]|uniref:DUF2150 family protein n=1 Tax=unclassified Halorhabdus TaxID=2621901 RepID=UPI0012B2E17D|nr:MULTISPECIES: DUF2150 family protein [unclassified Halorhabdus]QGN06887.1 DUF2150 family protein [Halorhabdus sp. CBA1104]